MPEYVTKEAVKQAMRSQPRGVLFTEWELDQVPTGEAVPVVHGWWKRRGRNLGDCSECGEVVMVRYPYCPNCGAKMDGGTK